MDLFLVDSREPLDVLVIITDLNEALETTDNVYCREIVEKNDRT